MSTDTQYRLVRAGSNAWSVRRMSTDTQYRLVRAGSDAWSVRRMSTDTQYRLVRAGSNAWSVRRMITDTQYRLVRAGQPDALVAVADCANEKHVSYRQAQGLIADVDVMLWRGGYWPQPAEIWRVDDRARWLERLERATNEH